ncbi:MAG: arylsulfatase, partial [Arenibacter algicola]|nr:arylsulfatase [Arenibacter algicola]
SGAKRTFGQTGGLKGRKLWTTDAGFRVPGIIHWMGRSVYNGTSDAVVSALDLLPTLCELTGAELPNKELDGESFSSLFEKGEFQRKKPILYSFYNALNEHQLAMRHGNYKILARLKNNGQYLPNLNNMYSGNEKLIKTSKLSDFELYDLKEDRSETDNLITKKPEIFAEMKKLLEVEYGQLLAGSHIWERERP